MHTFLLFYCQEKLLWPVKLRDLQLTRRCYVEPESLELWLQDLKLAYQDLSHYFSRSLLLMFFRRFNISFVWFFFAMNCKTLQVLMITRKFLTARNTKKLTRVTWNILNRVRFLLCLVKLAFIKFTLCCHHLVFSILKVKAHAALSLVLILWR